ncbi:tyrosinase family oxidase copper chaperone [Streptomyces sp. NPDC012888]|uniref:apotyrosinase chaperone MelC1 n=1 Tax=Streptomyces sp. NPDC012888 TaxID=3364855 RepID=UPI00369D1D5A
MNMITRRRALSASAGTLTAVGLAGIAHAATAAPDPSSRPGPSSATGPATPAFPAAGQVDEVYLGRRIRITPAASGGHGGHGGHHGPAAPTVSIDGRELHVMRNADGSWISVVNHYETFPDLRALARAAVRELQGATLVPFGGAA